jgi:hypothetical protein
MLVRLEDKLKIFPFDWKLAWKYFEKYLKQRGIKQMKDASERREHIIAFVRSSLNKNKIKLIRKEQIPQVEQVLKSEAGENPFYQKSTDLFVEFLKTILS